MNKNTENRYTGNRKIWNRKIWEMENEIGKLGREKHGIGTFGIEKTK